MRIAIIDDYEEDRLLVCNHLHTYFSLHTGIPLLISQYENGETFLNEFLPGSFDLVFMDIFMKQTSGFEVACTLRKTDLSAIIIFITSSCDYAVDGYSVHASGYLIKPYTYEQFYKTMSFLNLDELKSRQFIELHQPAGLARVLLKDIIYCDILGHYTQIHTINSGILRIRMTFSSISSILSGYEDFLLCYRGCIINMNQIVRIENQAFVMTDGDYIPFRKKQQHEIMTAYSSFLFAKVRRSDK